MVEEDGVFERKVSRVGYVGLTVEASSGETEGMGGAEFGHAAEVERT